MIRPVLYHLFIMSKSSLLLRAVAGVLHAVKVFPGFEKMLASIEEGTGKMEYIDLLNYNAKYFGPGNTFCAHAPGAAEPLQSGLRYFHDDFVKHITGKKMPLEVNMVKITVDGKYYEVKA